MRNIWTTLVLILLVTVLPAMRAFPAVSDPAAADLVGWVADPQGAAVVGASVTLLALDREAALMTATDQQGHYEFHDVLPGKYTLKANVAGFDAVDQPVLVSNGEPLIVDVQLKLAATSQEVRVSTDVLEVSVLNPDPAQRLVVREETLDANPGRPGAPVSIPGLPIETASGGIKAPQYFAPGVAGDHGEPIAQFLQIGDGLLPNNLSANAHGNGYADPNLLISGVIGSVRSDGGAFNPRYGDHAVDLAVTYRLRDRLGNFAQFTSDRHDLDFAYGWSPVDPAKKAWIAVESSLGNGYLARPEGRRQYKVNAFRSIERGRHDLSILGVGYYGFSRIPGLVPVGIRVSGDTIDPRQADLTHTGLLFASDTWHRSQQEQVQLSGYFRTYSLHLTSNFGDGLIRQSEFRTVAGGNLTYVRNWHRDFSILGGLDLRRDSPRDVRLDRADDAGLFHTITRNDFTIASVSPFVSASGGLGRHMRYNAGVRQDEFLFHDTERLNAVNSYRATSRVTSPKATITLLPPDLTRLPILALSYGEAFHINDPRIGMGASRGTPVARSRAYQLVATKVVKGTEFRTTLSRRSNSSELAKIDPDTGLQQDVGPSLIRAATFSVRRYFRFGSIQASFSRAVATDLAAHSDVPEAPRLIWDVLATEDHLPFHLTAKAEFEDVGRKPLGDGFVAVPLREFRGGLFRSFDGGRIDAALNFLIARGYTGQTLEVLQLPGEASATERPVGVRLASYASVSFTYHFGPAR